MLSFTGSSQAFLCVEPIDMRKGFEGLYAVVSEINVPDTLMNRPTTGTSANVVVTPHGITTDASGKVIVIGYFGVSGSTTQATVDFDLGPGVTSLTNTCGWDPFIWKLDANGNFLWARTFGSTTPNTATDERCCDEHADRNGSIFVSGFLAGTYDLYA